MYSFMVGPQYLCADLPSDRDERRQLLTSAMNGLDIHRLPKYYRTCKVGEWYSGAKSIAALKGQVTEFDSLSHEFDSKEKKCGWRRLLLPQGEAAAVVCDAKNAVAKYVK
jgi:hypothetical protein